MPNTDSIDVASNDVRDFPAPAPSGAAISPDGGSLLVSFPAPLGGAGAGRDFSLSSACGVSETSLSGDGLTLTLTLRRPAFAGESPQLSYAGTDVLGADGAPVQPFSGLACANNSARRALGPPAALNVAYPNFTWPAVAGATGYRLRASGVVIYDTANAAGPNTLTAFTDPAASDGRPVDQPVFTVCAYDGTGEGPQSGTPLGVASLLLQQAAQSVTVAAPQRVILDDVRYDVPLGSAALVPASVKSILQQAGVIS